MTTHTDAEIGAAVRVLASLFLNPGTAVQTAKPGKTTSGTATGASTAGPTQTAEPSSPEPSQAGASSSSTQDPPKAEGPDQAATTRVVIDFAGKDRAKIDWVKAQMIELAGGNAEINTVGKLDKKHYAELIERIGNYDEAGGLA